MAGLVHTTTLDRRVRWPRNERLTHRIRAYDDHWTPESNGGGEVRFSGAG